MNIGEFQKVELRVGKILVAERVPNSEKLIRLEVDLREKNEAGGSAVRQIIAGIAKSYAPEELVGKEIVVVANLEPLKLRGLESQGMLLAAHDAEGNPVLLVPEKEVSPGSAVS